MNTPREYYSRAAETAPFENLVAVPVSWQPRLMGVYASGAEIGARETAMVYMTRQEAESKVYPTKENLVGGIVQAGHGWRGFVRVDE